MTNSSFAPCPHCFESSGYEERTIPATWWDPSYSEADYTRRCPHCGGTGLAESEPVTLEDLESEASEEMEAAGRCSMGVGCDEAGVCYAKAHGRPEMCPLLDRSR